MEPAHYRPLISYYVGMEFAWEGSMASWMERILLTAGYGKGLLILGGLFNVICATLLASAFSYAGVVWAFMLKTVFTAVVLYLRKQFEKRDAVFFYINLGLTRKGMMAAVLAADYLVLAILLTIIMLVR